MFIYIITYLYLFLPKTAMNEGLSAVAVLDKGIFPVDEGSAGLQFYVDVENLYRSSCKIRSWPKICCFDDEPYMDCCSDAIYGDNIESIKPKARETLIYVYPTLYQHDLVGYCDFVVDIKCGRQKRSTQLSVSIPFNTRMRKSHLPEYLKRYTTRKRKVCRSIDEDVLNNCAPVNCDLKYSGRRPFFDSIRRKCMLAPDCETDLTKELPDMVYVPESNICRDLDHILTLGDIYSISTGLGVVTKATEQMVNDFKFELKPNCSTVSQNLILLKDLMTGKLCPMLNGITTDYSDCCKNAILSILGCIIGTCTLLFSIICCIHVTICLYKRWSKEDLTNILRNWKSNITKEKLKSPPSQLNKDLTNDLLKDVITRDLPLELRGSVVDICDKVRKKSDQKRRYRVMELGSQINIIETDSNSSSDSSERSENNK